LQSAMSAKRGRVVAKEPPPKKKKIDAAPAPKTPFWKILEEGGLLRSDNSLTVSDIAKLKGFLKKKLELAEQTKNEFVKSMKQFYDENDNLALSLRATTSPASAIEQIAHDSLSRILLSVPPIQSDVIEVLLNKLSDFESDSATTDIPRLILCQFRWLDSIEDNENLVNKLLEAMGACSGSILRDIITFLPEIIADVSHGIAVEALLDLLSTNTEFVAPILDALSNLSLDETLQERAISSVLQLLESANSNDLPAVVKFLIQTSDETLEKVVSALRKYLNLDSLLETGSTQPSKSEKEQLRDNEKLLFDAFRAGMQFKHKFSAELLKVLQNVPPKESFTLDFWLMVILCNIPKFKTALESLFVKKITTGAFDIKFLGKCIINHPVAALEFHSVLLNIAGFLFQKTQKEVREFGKYIYLYAFQVDPDSDKSSYYKQQIVAKQISHIGSGVGFQIDIALETLIDIANESPDALASYISFLEQITGGYLTRFSDSQVRQTYKLFTSLAYGRSASASAIAEKLRVMNLKQLTTSKKSEKIGVIGAVCILEMLSTRSDQRLKQLGVQMLDDVAKQVKYSSLCKAFLFDELCPIIPMMDTELRDVIFEKFAADFQDNFLGETSESVTDSLWMGLGGTNVVNIGELAHAQDEESRNSLVYLHPQVRLLIACELSRDNTLEDLESLFINPLRMFNADILQTFKTTTQAERSSIVLSLYHAVNWIRELLNNFSKAGLELENFRENILLRVEHLIDLESKLNKCLEWFDTFSPPGFTRTVNSTSNPKSKTTKSKTKAKDDESGNSKPFLEPYLNVLRCLNWDLTAILKFTDLATDEPIPMKEDVLLYLLEDLCGKLKILLPIPKKGPFAVAIQVPRMLEEVKAQQVLTDMCDIIPCIISRLGTIYEELETAKATELATNIADERVKTWKLIMCTAFRCLQLVLSYPELQQTTSHEIYVEILQSFFKSSTEQLGLLQGEVFKELLGRFSGQDVECERALIDVLCALVNEDSPADSRCRLSLVTNQVLQKPLVDSVKPEVLEHLLVLFITYSNAPLESIKSLSEELRTLHSFLVSKAARDKDSASGSVVDPDEEDLDQIQFKTLTEGTMPVFFQVVLHQLASQFAATLSISNSRTRLQKLSTCSSAFADLMNLNKSEEKKFNKPIAKASLRRGKEIIEVMVKSIPFFKKAFSESGNTISAILRNIRQSTKMMQILCAHGKVIQDTSLSVQVPRVKKVMESFIFKVQGLFAEGSNEKMVKIAVYKYKNIAGETVSSQISTDNDGEDPDPEGENDGDNEDPDDPMDAEPEPEDDIEDPDDENSSDNEASE